MSFDQALTTLQESIAQDAFLQAANFEPYIITKSLAYHKNNIDATLKALTKCAKWHKEYLGHQSKRVSIVHVHAFLLMEIATFVPHAKDPEGRPIYLFYGFKDTRSVPKQFHATFNMWNHFRILRSADHDNDNYTLVVNLEGSKLKNFRPSQYKRLDEANACQPLQSTDTTLYVVNASKFTEKLVNASLRIMKSMGPSKLHFIKPAELSNHLDVSLIPVDFGGRRSLGDARVDMEDFIREEYAREGLRYEAIDVGTINWKSYKVPDLDLTIRPDTAMSIASNMDFDQLDAQLEKMGLNDASEE
ncbi:hypothetical protein BDR26DRAFT_857893 [Obelidium mucronatum]|nr:hypothetical protein BDR26DRAFT_857893 [Obelidium mucronatum]